MLYLHIAVSQADFECPGACDLFVYVISSCMWFTRVLNESNSYPVSFLFFFVGKEKILFGCHQCRCPSKYAPGPPQKNRPPGTYFLGNMSPSSEICHPSRKHTTSIRMHRVLYINVHKRSVLRRQSRDANTDSIVQRFEHWPFVNVYSLFGFFFQIMRRIRNCIYMHSSDDSITKAQRR